RAIARSLPPQAKRPGLLAAGGFAVFDRLPGLPDDPAALLREAVGLAPQAERQHHDNDAAEDSRGGAPARRLFSSPGGPLPGACSRAPLRPTETLCSPAARPAPPGCAPRARKAPPRITSGRAFPSAFIATSRKATPG